jgi:crotonobetainyl-CoA:carnitine CoA-transferase CaiB-like acyl-CoA transferase
VLDLTRILAGPWCTQLLADLGAEVTKVERPGAGDDTRTWGPPFLHDANGAPTDASAYYLCVNRNKRSVSIDITHRAGQDLVRRLARESDVVIENYRVGQLARYGLDAQTLCAADPRLIYCSVTGFGQTGPYQDRAGYDFVVQGMSGLMSVTGTADGLPGGGPQKVGVAVVDLMTGMYAAVAILSALAHRERTGAGQVIDLALLDCAVAMMANVNANYLLSGRTPQRWGNEHPTIVPYTVLEAADIPFVLAVGNDAQFARFCAVAGCAPLAEDPRFATNGARVRHREALIEGLRVIVRAHPAAWWLQRLEDAGVPCGPINTIPAALDDPQVRARGMRVDLQDREHGRIGVVGNPIHFSATPPRYDLAPPRLGEHTDAVLAALGLTPEEIAALRAQGTV